MKKFHIIPTIILFFLISATVNTGCTVTDTTDSRRRKLFPKYPHEFTSISYHKSTEYDSSNIQRVLLLPFTVESGRDKVVDEVTEAFLVELQKKSTFEIVKSQEFQDILSQQKDVWSRGLIKPETIVEAKNRYKVDAIIIGKITQYQPYEPPVLGIKIGMFSARSGNIMWSTDAIFDSSEASVIQLLKTYYKKTYQKKQSLYDWKIILLSMKRYARFVAYHMVDTL